MLHVMGIIVMATWAGGLATPQKPVIDSPIVADVYDLPSTVEGLMDRADAVVIARITRVTNSSVGQRARTDYGIELVSVVKEHSQLSGRSTVCRAIGTIDYPDRTVRVFEPHLPGFEPGTEYLLFLGWDDKKACFFPAFGPPGVAIVDATKGVTPFVNHPALSGLRGLKQAELARRLVERAGRE